MGNSSSTQRGGKVAQSQTVLQESTNANTPKNRPQATNIAKDNDLISPNTEYPKKEDARPTESPSDVMTAMDSKAHTSTTNPTTKIIVFSPPVGKVSDIGAPKPANAVTPSEAPILEAVTSQHTGDASNRALASERERETLKRINTRDPKMGARPEKRLRKARGRGKGKGKGKDKVAEALQEDIENIPPPTARQNVPSRRRRARSSGRVENGTGLAPRHGRAPNSLGGAETAARVVDLGGTRKHGRSLTGADSEPQRSATRHLPSKGKGKNKSENMAIPNADRFRDSEAAADRRLSEGNFCRSVTATLQWTAPSTNGPGNATRSSSPCEETGFLKPTAEDDVSTVHPLPSSTRRRAKEYFQRRTRERSVDAARRHISPPRRGSTVLVTRSQLDLNEAAVTKPATKPSGRSTSLSEKPDHFVFDPVASPFTPNATSSPRQVSPSSIAVQSFSSPTPLPSHGNRKVTPLILPKPSNRNTLLEMRSDSVPHLIPLTSHSIQGTHGLAYTYTGTDQAHIQAEQLALIRLQAYYNWLAGSTPMTGVVTPVSACGHTDMSGGGGGLSGGVALGRQGQNQGRGKGQCRNTSGAYAHPKEHVVFSPGDHEQTELASQSALQHDSSGQQGGQTGLVKIGKGGAQKEESGDAQSTVQKWDGKWGLRDAGMSSKEIGWSWGRVGAVPRVIDT